MKIFIGITQDPNEIQELFSKYHGKIGSLTEVGPFPTKEEVVDWLTYLKSKIGNIEELISESNFSTETGWYGFTFEQTSAIANNT